MKDYSWNEQERKEFILNYTKEEDTITVNFADGNSYTVPNTENNENTIESKMIEQVAKSKEKRNSVLISRGINILSILIITAASVVGATKVLDMALIKEIGIGLGMAAVVNIPVVTRLVKNNNMLKDIQKNRFFVKNQEVINRGIVNTNVLVNSNVQNNEIITINDIDNGYKYNELKRIVENTEVQDKFAFDTFPEEVVQDKPKTKVRRR